MLAVKFLFFSFLFLVLLHVLSHHYDCKFSVRAFAAIENGFPLDDVVAFTVILVCGKTVVGTEAFF